MSTLRWVVGGEWWGEPWRGDPHALRWCPIGCTSSAFIPLACPLLFDHRPPVNAALVTQRPLARSALAGVASIVLASAASPTRLPAQSRSAPRTGSFTVVEASI